ncbi:unnamed protein product [Linum trigynum]|uniref:Uncharacterized protein n=1 Tax=Linum trigynum TaxID=586398 RepID=A0AAV2G4V9_9ROSI
MQRFICVQFFSKEPVAYQPCSLPIYPPSKELDVKLRDEEARRQRGLSGKGNGAEGARKVRNRPGRAVPAAEANAEIPANVDRWRLVTQANAKRKSEKFPPPHQDGEVGGRRLLDDGMPKASFSSSVFTSNASSTSTKSAGSSGGSSRRRNSKDGSAQIGPSRKFIPPFNGSTIGLSMDLLFKCKSENFGSRRQTGR